MLNAEVHEMLLNGCVTWSPDVDHCVVSAFAGYRARTAESYSSMTTS